MSLLPMDIACLEYLAEHGDNGSMPTIAIPNRLFRGEIPDGIPDLVELGLIEHHGDRTAITLLGRMAIPPAHRNSAAEGSN
jgi:hypothetical protein